ncbi:tetratricopeptide repeat protein [Breznakiella homolactica]|uniref:Tetratricopeptide repeat protein n=1 Tax=Breznakiella homolactica TaxID=2798577 RepID=A0A7T7XM19_9SPIR|nr:tetratricopeptide repeat protein [Breznakiella homolactica]QQO08713.1 tetratricopeptide repeat protein [Breznakiella homolactica]
MIKKYIVFLLLPLVFLSPNSSLVFGEDISYENDIDYLLTKYFLGEHEEVIRLLNKYFITNQQELSYLYGLCYLHLNMNTAARDYFLITLKEHENNYEVLNNIGVSYYQDRDYANALKYFHLSFISNTDYLIARENYNTVYEKLISGREIDSIQPIIPFTEKPSIYNSLGWFYYYCGDHHNAVYYLKKSIEEDEKYQFSYISLAYLYDEGNNFTTALYYLTEAEKIDQNNPDLQNNLGVVYYHLKDFEKSENAFKKAIDLNYMFAEPYNNLGFLYLEQNKNALSEEYFLKSNEVNLNNQSLRAESFAGLSILLKLEGNNESARSYKDLSVSLDYRMNDIQYIVNKLQWNKALIAVWESI